MCQRIGGLWRIHAIDLPNRAKLAGETLRILRVDTELGENEPDVTENSAINDRDKWELIKTNARESSQLYGRFKAKSNFDKSINNKIVR